jgi:hypothetical protein
MKKRAKIQAEHPFTVGIVSLSLYFPKVGAENIPLLN